jgi:hypothetical protein
MGELFGFNEELSTPDVPVIEKKLEPGVVAEANKDSTIFIDPEKAPTQKDKKHAVDHEMVHIGQLKRGELNYDNKNVYWKGQTIARSELQEGNKELPWEKPAYEQVKKS